MRYLLTLFCTLLSSTAFAGLAINGKLADVQHLPAQSIEGKIEFVTGDSDLTTYGGRFNLKYSEKLLLTGTLAAVSADSDDGTLYGVGAQYVIDGVLETMDFATFGSYQRISGDGDANLLTIGAVASSRDPIGANKNLYWYGNLFIARASGDGSETDLGFGGGLVMPTASGEWFGGIDIVEDPIIGFGFRYFLK
jgi:hypothetical protein